MEKNKEQRLEYIDLIKGFSILLVVLGHIYDFENNIKIWIYSFHMPLFFILSGFFSKNSERLDILINKKIKSLIVPYITFGVCIICLLYITYGLSSELKTYILFFITGVGRDALWFLPALFIVEILFYLINKEENKFMKYTILMMLFLIGLYGKNYYENMFLIVIYRVFIGLGFYALGNCMYGYISKISISYFNLFIIFSIDLILSLYNGCIDLWGLNFNDRLIYIICSILGSFIVILFFKKINDVVKYKNILKFFGTNTLIIMSTQQVIINYINMITGIYYYNTKEGFFIFLIVMIIELPIIYMVNKYLPFMTGKFNKRQKFQVA